MKEYDTIIIGAGPAGLQCAKTLGNSKHSVLLLEKNRVIGPKICAGGLTPKAIKKSNLPTELIDYQYNKAKLHIDDSLIEIESETNFAATIDRKELGQWQLKQLKDFSNIKIQTNITVDKIEKNYIIVDGEKIKYKHLVGADGSTSTVRKHLGLKTEDQIVAIQYIIPTNKYKDFEIFLNSKLFSAWYAWIFPHKNYVSIGCGCDPKTYSIKDLKQNFLKWTKENKIDTTTATFEAFTLSYNYQNHQFENIFLIGDAGGFVSGLTGEGIYQALVSGEEIAKTILDQNYKSAEINKLLHTKKQHNALMNFLIKAGRLRQPLFTLTGLLFKIPYFKKKAIKFLA